jgi:hypothetical protein
VEDTIPKPTRTTVREAYEADRADALTVPSAGAELAGMVAGLIGPWLEQIAAGGTSC